MYLSTNEQFPKIRKSSEFMSGIYKSYDKQIMPTLPNFTDSIMYPRPISKGTYLRNDYQERNELLLTVKQQNVGIKFMIQQLKEDHEKEKKVISQQIDKMREELIFNSEKLKYNTNQLEEIKVQLRALARPRLIKRQNYWRKAVRGFINIYRMYMYALELAWNRPYKNRMIRSRELHFTKEISDLRKWMFSIQSEFMKELVNIEISMDFFNFEYFNKEK